MKIVPIRGSRCGRSKVNAVTFLVNDVTIGGSAATVLPSEIVSWRFSTPRRPLAGRWRNVAADGTGVYLDGFFSLVNPVMDGLERQDRRIDLEPPPTWGGTFVGPDYHPVAGAWSAR